MFLDKLEKRDKLKFYIDANLQIKVQLNYDSGYPVETVSHGGQPINENEDEYSEEFETLVMSPQDMDLMDQEFEFFIPIAFRMSDLDKPMKHELFFGGKEFIPIEFFEVSDDHTTCPVEQDNGNIFLLSSLKGIMKAGNGWDTQFLPLWVIDLLVKWGFWLWEEDFEVGLCIDKRIALP